MRLLVRKKDVKWRNVGNEVIIYNKLSQKVHVFNKTAMDIWILCDGHNEIENMIDKLEARYSISRKELRADIIEAINTFEKLQLLEKNE